MICSMRLAACALVLLSVPRPAGAWTIGSQLNEKGCHELITAQALRNVRAQLGTAPAIAPTRDERALISDVLFSPPDDFKPDLAGMSLLLGVRDNDLKGIDPLDSFSLIQVHGNPETQDEHCLRSGSDDGSAGDLSALATCRQFIHAQAVAALAGLAADGSVDASVRTEFQVYVSIAGDVRPPLPLFYIKIGAAMHALEDGYPHTYRGADGTHITTVLNWIDLVDGAYDEERDGPGHRTELDDCTHDDPTIQRDFTQATNAATALLMAALDPALTPDAKAAQFDAVTAQYLAYTPGCTFDNQWCSPLEATVRSTGCSAGGAGAGLATMALVLLTLALGARRRHRPLLGALVLALGLGRASTARADDPPVAPDPAADPAPAIADPAPAVPLTPADGKEPKRDVKTPTVAEVQAIRKAKELGSPYGFAVNLGGSIDRTAIVGSVGFRYRLDENWVIGVDAGWNPWITTSPLKMTDGVAEFYLTVIRRYPMKYDRVNLRTSAHLGTSVLLFDVYGSPKHSVGAYGAISLLGIDYDLGNSWRIVVDPMEIAFPVPEIGDLPLYYEQFRFVIGIQYGS